MPGIYGQLQAAALEVLSSDPTATTQGRIYLNSTTTRPMMDDGTNKRALLRNDQYCVFGSNATANSNVRFNRAGAAVLQLVQGGDTTAEGSLSTSLAQISVRQENYATGSVPAAGSAGRMYFNTSTNLMYVDNGTTWSPIGSGGGYSVFSTQTITTGSAISPSAAVNNQRQLYPVVGTSGQTAISSTPFGTLASIPDGYEFTLVGTDDTNTVVVTAGGRGATLSAGIVVGDQTYELGLGVTLCLVKMTIASTAVLVVQ